MHTLSQLIVYPLTGSNVVPAKKITKTPYIPPEIIRIILSFLRNDRKTLAACALVNHTFNLHATPILYHTVAFTFPHTFTLFVDASNDIKKRCSHMVRHLDLSSFSTCGLQKSSFETQNVVTPDLLIHTLRSFPELKAFSVSESLESVVTLDVLKVLFLECKNIKAIDFCGCVSKQFSSALDEFSRSIGRVKIEQSCNDYDETTISFHMTSKPLLSHLQRLSFHECPTISEYSTIIPLLAHTPNLTHLDLGGCSISDLTLNFLAGTNIPTKLSHLLLAKCKNISSDTISSLVSKCSQLETLNLYGDRDITTAIKEYDLVTILRSPNAKNFRTLDIGSSQITPLILTAIKENCPSLQNLGISKAQITNLNLIKELLTSLPNLQYIDLTSIPCFNILNANNLLTDIKKNKHPIHTIEMSESLLKKLYAVDGWKIDVNYGRRWYYSREAQREAIRPDRVHGRKLDITGYGPEFMSKIFQYYSFDA
ncbi:16314_t:CDS:1 [Dentiscutata heterogama]|uniref:16314_t:CDS:1 n=1 Tax=Dentiscutata heterogama TaxID=1316150 RepID=A0ACA9KFW0_9GLOM|nr:16314_t:CDS:1 [Dentiscutata heterogama]